MRLFNYDISLRKRLVASSSTLANPSSELLEALLSRASASGVRVTPLSTLGVPTVIACVNAVSRTMASVPLKLYRRTPNGGQEVATDHYLYDLLSTSPVPGEMTTSSFVRAVQANATLRNSGSALINRNGLGEVAELIPIEPQDLERRKDSATGRVKLHLKGVPISSRDILTIKGLTFNGITGADPLRYARDAIGLTISLQDNAARFFGNGSRPGGILSHPAELSEAAQERLKKKFTQDSSGPNAYALMVLEEGLTYASQRTDNDSSQFDESRARQDKAICRIYGVQPSKVGILDDAHYNNVEQENLNYVKDTILPWAVEWEQTLNMQLLRNEEKAIYFFKFNLEGLMRGDLLSRYQAAAIGRNWGWLSVNEIRRMEELPPIGPEGDIYLQPLNMQEAGQPLDAPTSANANPKKQPPKSTPTT